MAVQELDIRLYDKTGKRKRLPQSWVTGVDFEVGEKGGYQNGTLTVQAKWEDLSLEGTEYVDLYREGTLLYRGYVMHPQQDLDDPEKWTLNLYGLMDRLNGYLVRHCYCYQTAVDISTVFEDIAAEYVTTSDRLPSLVIDVTGVSGVGITFTEFCAKGKSVSQAFNQLVEMAPDELIWGCDVDGSGNDRLYLYPRPTETAYRYSVGKDVTAFVYPRDVTQVVNKVYVSGGSADPANVAPNPSFENCSAVDDNENNLLLNAGFEENTGTDGYATSWTMPGNLSLGAKVAVYPDSGSTNHSHGGNSWVVLDYFVFHYMQSDPNTMSQTLQIGFPQKVRVGVWARQQTADGSTSKYRDFRIVVYAKDAGGTTRETFTSSTVLPTTEVWTQYTFECTPTDETVTQVVVQFEQVTLHDGNDNNPTDKYHVLLDDATFAFASVTADGWRTGASSNAFFEIVDWHSSDYAYEGSFSVQLKANITGGGGYGEICTRTDKAIDVKPGKSYYFTVYAKTVDSTAPTFKLGLRQFAESTQIREDMGALQTTTSFADWTRFEFSMLMEPNCNKLEPFLRVYNGGEVYFDGVMVTQGLSTPLEVFYSGGTFEAIREVTDYSSGDIGTDAHNSISTYGLREKEESVEHIRDVSTLDAYCKAYFKAHAIPAIQAKLTLKGTNSSLLLAGKVKLLNLASAPSPLFPVRVRYKLGESWDIEADLNSERPDLAILLRKLTANVPKSNTTAVAVGGNTTSRAGNGAVLTVASDSNDALVGDVQHSSGRSVKYTQNGQIITADLQARAVSELSTLEAEVGAVVFVDDATRGGHFRAVGGRLTPDNGILFASATSGWCWQRIYAGASNAQWFGTSPNVSTFGNDVILNANPTSALQAATKGYVDSLTSSNVSVLLRKLMTLQEDAVIVVISDSTGNGDDRFIYQLAGLVAPLWSRHTVEFYQWGTTDYGGATTLQTGSSGFKLQWYNCAVSGKTTAYTMGDKWANAVASKRPDLIIINHGHNQTTYTTNNDNFRQNVEGAMRSLVEMLRHSVPDAGVIANLQNPTKAVAGVGQQIRAGVYASLFGRLGGGTVDTLSLFLNADGSVDETLLADNAHPTTAGSTLQAKRWLPLFEPREAYESFSLQAPATAIVGKSLLTDPYLLYDLVTNSKTNLTVERDTTYIDGSSISSLKLTGAAGTQGNFVLNSAVPVAKLAGQWVTAWVREYLPTGAYSSAGRIGLADGSGNSVVSDAPAAEANDGWITHCVSFQVATTGATYLRLTYYAGTSGTSAVYLSEIHWVEGRNPHLSAPRPNTTPAPANLVPASVLPAYDFNGTTGTGIAANNSVFNFGTSNFGIGILLTLRTLTPTAEMPLVNCFSGNSGWKLALTTGGLLKLSLGTGSAFTTYSSTSAVGTLTGVGVPTPIVVAITRAGSVVFYVGGQQLGAGVAISAQSATSVTTAGSLQMGVDGSSYASTLVSGFALFNGVVDASAFGVHGLNLVSKWGGRVAYQSDFSAGINSWVNTNMTLAGNVDGVSDGTTSYDNCLSATANTTSGSHLGGRYNDLTGGKTYRLTITYYIPSNCATLSGLRFYTQSGSNMSSTLADLTVKGAWTTLTVDFVNVAGNTGFQLRGINGSSSITWAGAAGAPYDMFYIANVTLTEIGAVVAYEGIPSAMMGTAWVQGNPSVTGADMVMSTGAVPNFPTTRRALQVLSANTTLDRTYETVLVDTSGGTKTITMPLASSSYGMRVYLKRVGVNAVTIARSGSDTFFDTSSVTSLSLASDGAKVVLEADAANSRWIVVG